MKTEREYRRKYRASLSPEKKAEFLLKGREHHRKHYAANKARILAKRKKYYLANEDEVKEKRRAFYSVAGKTPKYVMYCYRNGARKRGLCFDLSSEQFVSFWQKSCHYCGDAIKTIGLDRVDNSVGYTAANVVPCCRPCNVGKMTMAPGEFIARAHRISSRHKIDITT